jgi:DNA polymerase
MKQLEFTKIIGLVKTILEDEESWGIYDLPVKGQDARTQEALNIAQEKPSIRGDMSKTDTEVFNAPNAKEKTGKPVSKNKAAELEALRKKTDKCRNCDLGSSRLHCVFGEGSPDAKIMFIGEGPGYSEDHEGLPFIGRAGQLLTKIIEAMNFKREDVYITNIVKCHPMKNPDDPESRANDRPPTPEESQTCQKYLDMQIDIIKPKVLITLGAASTKTLLDQQDLAISKVRGIFSEYKTIMLMPTYHPAALLRNPNLKKDVWQDMKAVMAALK